MSKIIASTPKARSLLPQSLQEREQLLKAIVDKLYKDLGRNSITNHYIIEEVVKGQLGKEKVNQQVLKGIRKEVEVALRAAKSCSGISANRSLLENSLILNSQPDNLSVKSGCSQPQPQHQHLPPIRNNMQSRSSSKTHSSTKSKLKTDAESDTSSVFGKSVYYVDGNGENQWASLVKYDSELYKKQLELTRLRENQFKKKMKLELDQQIKQKKQREQKVKKQNQAYGDLQTQIYNSFVREQQEKNQEKRERLEAEKKMRDRQIKDVKKRKREEVKRENQYDRQLVSKIEEELGIEQEEGLERRRRERERQRLIQQEGEIAQENKMRERKEQREEEIRQQNQYNLLHQKMAEQKQQEKKEREDKIKEIMVSFANTVGKEQKDLRASEDSKILAYIHKQIQQKQKEEKAKRVKKEEEKRELKEFFDHQVEEKRQRKIHQESINKVQAELWREDAEHFKIHEGKRVEYMNEMKKRHNQVLEMQIMEKEGMSGKAMNTAELLYNKGKIKDLGRSNEMVKKAVVPF